MNGLIDLILGDLNFHDILAELLPQLHSTCAHVRPLARSNSKSVARKDQAILRAFLATVKCWNGGLGMVRLIKMAAAFSGPFLDAQTAEDTFHPHRLTSLRSERSSPGDPLRLELLQLACFWTVRH